jgi:3',5'-cyclic-AMP phosphodiesterase
MVLESGGSRFSGVCEARVMDADLVLAFVSDIHVGPEALFDGKLRKLTAHALPLLADVVATMNREVRPDVLVNLGDDIEDEGRTVDVERLRAVLAALSRFDGELLHVAGNHDTVHVTARELGELWSEAGFRRLESPDRLYYATRLKGFHVVVLHTHERKDESVTLDEPQLGWFADRMKEPGPKVVLMHHSAADQILTGNRWFERAPHICLVRERRRLRESMRGADVRVVVNGHLHWNHLDVLDGVPFVTVQSLVENLDSDAPGRPARGHAVVRLGARRTLVTVLGEETARYQFG